VIAPRGRERLEMSRCVVREGAALARRFAGVSIYVPPCPTSSLLRQFPGLVLHSGGNSRHGRGGSVAVRLSPARTNPPF
jgi:hypothetical protein